jgi:arylsulfatase
MAIVGLLTLSVMAERPNIIIIMADDMGYSDLGCYGSEISTPNLDQLADEGIRYSQMYNTSKCTTSRSALLTGRYVSRKTWDQNYSAGPTFGEIAKAAGYRTLWSGKNHSTILPPERGFDRFYGFQGGACNFWNPGGSLRDGGAFPYIKAYEWMVNDQWLKSYIPEDPDYYMTDAITDNALTWLKQYQGEEQPFLLYLAYNAPHWPLHARDRDIAKYKGAYDAGYQAIRQARYERMVEKGYIDPETAPLHPETIKDWNTLSAKQKKLEAQRMEIHAAMVDSLDQNIGRMVDELKAQGELENTLILFFVDNGASHERDTRAKKNYKPTGTEKMGSVMSYECIGKEWARVVNCPLARHKTTSHEGGVCSPMIAHWPKGMGQAGWDHQPAHLVDIMSTVMELSGQDYPAQYKGKTAKPIEGVSLVPSFSNKSLAHRKSVIGFDFGLGRGIRDGKWKLVSYKNDAWELYDMSTDRTETKNRALQMPEKVKAMEKAFNQWKAQCSAGLATY